MKEKTRLDRLVQEKYPQYSRQQIQSWIMQAKVSVDGQIVTKAGTLYPITCEVILDTQEPKYVSRAGFKLEAALEHWQIQVNDLICMDAGISTGGFTDCLLQNGARRVYGIDVGWGQVHPKIVQNNNVILYERTNLRHLTELPELVDIVTLDLSFISVLKVMHVVINVLKPEGTLIVLIKPQFEAQRHQVGRGGIISSDAVHQEVIEKVVSGIVASGFESKGVIPSPITGTGGNKEFLAYFVKL